MNAGNLERFQDAHRRFLASRGLDDGSPEGERRSAALLSFLGQGLPTRKHEDWKFTDLKPLRTTEYELPPDVDLDGLRPAVERIGVSGTHRFVFVNGRLAENLSTRSGAAAGLSAGVREPGCTDGPAKQDDVFTELNTAFLEQGFEITVDQGVELSQPIELLFLSTGNDSPFMVHSRVRVTLADGARATLLEQFVSLDGTDHFNSLVSEIEVGADATLMHSRILEEGERGCQVAINRVRVGRNGHYGSTIVQLSGQILRNDLRVVLDGTGAHGDLFGLYRLGGRMHADNHTVMDHKSSATTSRELYKGILEGAASGAFFGRIVVREQAQKINARQTNNNLLLSPEARVDSTPQLEIYADDVQCRHGSTIGRLDENMLFYLRSRGISEQRARDLLIYAFANEIIDTLPVPELRERLAARLVREAGQGALAPRPQQEQLS